MIAKAGLGLVGLGAIGMGGVAFVKPEWLGINRETKWAPLSKDSGYQDTEESHPYKDKFGSDYKNYLVGLDAVNKDWWDEKYESIKGQSRGNGKFKNVSSGYGSEANDLKKVCEDAYKTSESEFQSDGETEDQNKFKKEEVWKYCSPLGVSPKKVSAGDNVDTDYPTSGSTDPIGKSKKEELLSIKHTDNQKLWKLKNDEFFGLGVFKTETTKTPPSEQFFAKLFSGDDKGPNALKNKCADAYKLTSETSTDANKTSETEVLKYCSLKSIK